MSIDTNFIDINIWQGDDIYERFTPRLREEDPIYWSEQTELWMITGYEEAEFVSKNQQIFTSAQGVRPKEDTIIGLIDEDEPRHGSMRNMINRGFFPANGEGISSRSSARSPSKHWTRWRGKGECDFVHRVFGTPTDSTDRQNARHS